MSYNNLKKIYEKLFEHFGPQHWWPAESAFEVMVGAILTQNTSWNNVERAIKNLKKEKLLSPQKLYSLSVAKLGLHIRSCGYYNIKAERLRNFLSFFLKKYKGSIKRMAKQKLAILRKELLSIKGIGKETADSILLYALNKPIFVVDAYTKRIFSRHNLISEDATYDEVQKLCMDWLPTDTSLFNEFHALLVKLAKEYCLKSKPRCQRCPLKK
ncbi:MAG: endonuclease III domain-containing protein [Candidatus Omnitrophica bacterium]|nr:endonuclease III domain-containing protein [Candidatus Omnitrophota bacterium]